MGTIAHYNSWLEAQVIKCQTAIARHSQEPLSTIFQEEAFYLVPGTYSHQLFQTIIVQLQCGNVTMYTMQRQQDRCCLMDMHTYERTSGRGEFISIVVCLAVQPALVKTKLFSRRQGDITLEA